MSFTRFRERSRDVQDGIERHIWGERIYVKGGGSYMKDAKGTDTQDTEVTILDSGQSFNLKKDTNCEVWALASSSDTTLKMMVLTIPRDKQRRWMEGHGGVQHPTDPDFALDISDDLAHVTKNKFAVGEKGEFEIKGKEGYFRVDKLIVTGELVVNQRIRTPEIVSGTQDPPGFSGSKQAEVNDKDNKQQTMLSLAVDNTVDITPQIEPFVGAQQAAVPSERGSISGMILDCGTF